MQQSKFHGSTKNKLIEFFQTNNKEELTLQEVCIKFDITKTTAYLAINDLVREQYVEFVKVVRPKAKCVKTV